MDEERPRFLGRSISGFFITLFIVVVIVGLIGTPWLTASLLANGALDSSIAKKCVTSGERFSQRIDALDAKGRVLPDGPLTPKLVAPFFEVPEDHVPIGLDGAPFILSRQGEHRLRITCPSLLKPTVVAQYGGDGSFRHVAVDDDHGTMTAVAVP
jgi:hypothetical protein